MREDLSEALTRLVQRQLDSNATNLDGVILEQTVFADSFVQGTLHLDSVICVCDAARLGAVLSNSEPPSSDGSADGGSSIL